MIGVNLAEYGEQSREHILALHSVGWKDGHATIDLVSRLHITLGSNPKAKVGSPCATISNLRFLALRAHLPHYQTDVICSLVTRMQARGKA
jgi:hypothetical protein